MEPNESGLSSYYHHHHHHHHQQQQPQPQPPQQQHHHLHHQPSTASPTNGSSHMLYPNPIPSAVSSPLRRKRGRPRKYTTPEQAAAAKRLLSSSSPPSNSAAIPNQNHSALTGAPNSSSSSKKSVLGKARQAFTPHVITVIAGEDVGQKIMLFVQQSKSEICVLSASGAVSNASLRQPATSGGNITYEGHFDILTLCGSYVRTELGGRTGGLSVCLSSSDGQIIGGGVGGPLTAAGSVQVILGAFAIDKKIETVKADPPSSWMPSPVPSGPSFLPTPANQQNQYLMTQSRGMQLPLPSDWRSTGTASRSNVGYEFTGRVDESPENGEYEQGQDGD